MATAKVYIHGGDYDCSELARMCYRAVNVLPYGSYMWTGNEVALLTSYGFVKRSLSSPQVGDVLWREGHTEIYLGNNMQGGARHGDYSGGLDGRKGDQDGTEVTKSRYRASDWTLLLRYEGGKTIGGIPCAIAAALVADHIIDHNAHGYSQPNRKGDGTIEAVTITWDGSEKAAPAWIATKEPFEFVFDRETRVRTSPDTSTDANLRSAKWLKGDTAVFDGVAFGSGYIWGTYIGATTGLRLFSAMGPSEFGSAK